MGQIRVRGAREHNLRGIDLDLDHPSLIVVCGRSGSGKSSLAFDTLHAEARRRYVDVLALNARGIDRGLRAPDVDAIDGLPPTVALSQRFNAPAPQATVGTWSDAWSVVSVLFGRAGTLHCPVCDRAIEPVAQDDIVAELLDLPEGTRLHIEAPLIGEPAAVFDEVRRAGFSRVRIDGEVVRIEEADPRSVTGQVRVVCDRLKVAPDRADRVHDAVRLASRAGKGAVVAVTDTEERVYVDRPYCLHDDLSLPALEPRLFSLHGSGACSNCTASGRVGDGVCEVCDGTRLEATTRAVRYDGHRLDEVATLSLARLEAWVRDVTRTDVSRSILEALGTRVRRLRNLGLHEPSLLRGCRELSSGELQRLRLARQASAGLSGVLYVLDEPTAGLDDAAATEVVHLLRDLVQAGNSVVAVTHHEAVVRAADRVLEFGPGAGTEGGQLVFDGIPAALAEADTASGQWLSGRLPTPEARSETTEGLARLQGLKVPPRFLLDVELPVRGLGVIAGPSASGKTVTLKGVRAHVAARLERAGQTPPPAKAISGLDGFRRLVEVDAGSSRMQRSNPATYSGMWDTMRTLFAATRESQVRGLVAGQFSLNQAGGRCEACKGTGEQRVDLDLLADVYLPCPTCGGNRFAGDVLEVRWKGRNPSEILQMRVSDALPFLAGHPKLERSLRALNEVGLGYVTLGQPAHTLSGGETQRLRLARELARASQAEGVLVLLDDPTRGLHPADIVDLIGVFRRFCDAGGTVWVASGDPALAEAADGVFSLG